ncbi:MAG: hypothetical protein H6739_38725 [Alphaproteobacteria bacterium]|nr:hypothetical protein [Alphaproteobacteria bacterium]
MITSLLMGAALAAHPKMMDLKVVGPGDAVLLEETVELPYDGAELPADVGGVPYLVTLRTDTRHDTVIVEAVIYQLKGAKQKRKEQVRPKLILYEGYPGHVVVNSKVPRGYGGPDVEQLDWVVDAQWYEKKPEAPPAPVEPAPAPVEPAPAEPLAEPPAEPAPDSGGE